jgi:hypothetical protein
MYALKFAALCTSAILLTACSIYNPIKYSLASDKMLEKTGAFQEIDQQKFKDEILGFSIHPENKQVLITGKKFQYIIPPSDTLAHLMQPEIAQHIKLELRWENKPMEWSYSFVDHHTNRIDPPLGKANLMFCINKETPVNAEALIRSTMKMSKDVNCFFSTLHFTQYYKTTKSTAEVAMTKLSKPYPIILSINTLKDSNKLERQNRNAAILSPFAKVADATLTIGQYLALPITMWF